MRQIDLDSNRDLCDQRPKDSLQDHAQVLSEVSVRTGLKRLESDNKVLSEVFVRLVLKRTDDSYIR